MELTIGKLKQIIKDLPDDVILADLGYGNDRFHRFCNLKRLLLLLDTEDGQRYLTINSMGSHFNGTGEQSHLVYQNIYWDENNINFEQP